MDTEGKQNRDLAEELEFLREEIAHLHSLILCPPPGASPDAPVLPLSAREPLPATLLEDSPFGMALVDIEGRIINSNRMFRGMFDYAGTEIEATPFQDLSCDPDRASRLVRQIVDAVAPVMKMDGRFIRGNGEAFWAQITASKVTGSRGERRCCMIVVEDISDRKYAAEALQTEKQLLEWLINSSVDGIVAFDLEGFLTVWNPGMERIFGVRTREVLGRPAFLACPFLKDLGEDANFAAALAGNKVVSRDKCYRIPESSRNVYFEGYYGPLRHPGDGKVMGGLAIIRDVTERILAQEAKRSSEERYRELFENAHDMVYTCDLAGRITSLNKAAERILGYSREEARQMRFSQFVAPEFRPLARRMIDRQFSEEAPITQELDIIARDGGRVTLEVSSRLIFQEGKPFGIQAIARDISDRKKAEDALQTANQKLESWVRELEQRTREMTLLGEMGDILRACLTADEVYEVIVRAAKDIFPEEAGALYVMGPLRNLVESVAEWGDTTRMETAFSPEDCWALRRGRIHWVEDTRSGLLCRHLGDSHPKGYICVPMMAQSEAVGVLHLSQTEESTLTEAKQRLAIAMAERVAMALSNLRLHETLRNQSIRDPLTGLFNRSFLEESLELELRRAARTQTALSVIMVVLDEFQRIHESLGLDSGDAMLRSTAVLLQTHVRKGDIACRFSGHAFIVVLPQSSLEVGRVRAEALRSLVRTLEMKGQNEQKRYLSASVGLALYPEHGQTVAALLRAAEFAVSRARDDGGNCVVEAS